MDKLLFSEGGQPLHLDDLEFLQTSVQAPLSSFIAALGNYIIGGCVVTIDAQSKTAKWTMGYIAFGGKVYHVAAGSYVMADLSHRLYWVFTSTQGATKVFGDGSEAPTQQLNTATLISSPVAPVGEFLADDTALVLGEHIARVPHLNCSVNNVAGLRVLAFTELNAHTGVLTLSLEKGAYDYNSSLATISVQGMARYCAAPTPISSGGAILELAGDGKIYLRRAVADGASVSHYRLDSSALACFVVSWDNASASSSSSADSSGTHQGGRTQRSRR